MNQTLGCLVCKTPKILTIIFTATRSQPYREFANVYFQKREKNICMKLVYNNEDTT